MPILLPDITNEEAMEKAIALLSSGISISDWHKIRAIVDYSFQEKIGEFKQQLKLSDQDLKMPIHPLFEER